MNASSEINPPKQNTTLKATDNPKNAKHGSILSKISCKIGGHLGYAYINTGSSVSIASSDLYKKLVQDNCSFKERTGAVHLVDGVVPRQNYKITSTTVSVIGKTKSIDLLTFPNVNIEQTTLGMDFLSPKLQKDQSSVNQLQRAKFALNRNRNRSRHSNGEKSIDQSIQFFDSLLNIPDLETPIYDILTQGIATEKDIRTICTYMKDMNHSRVLSPIKSLQLVLNPL